MITMTNWFLRWKNHGIPAYIWKSCQKPTGFLVLDIPTILLTFAYMNRIEKHIAAIIALCKQYKVKKLFVFGSILTNRFNEKSDIDFLVDFNKQEIEDYFDNFFDFKYALEKLLDRDIDLVEEQTIRNPYLRKNIDNTKALIYGGAY